MAPPGMISALMPTTACVVTTFTGGRPSSAGAVKVSSVPLGWLLSVHFMSNAHSMVRPAMTVLSAAMMSTAVQASAC